MTTTISIRKHGKYGSISITDRCEFTEVRSRIDTYTEMIMDAEIKLELLSNDDD